MSDANGVSDGPGRRSRPPESAILSRHTGAERRRSDVRGWNLNAWCVFSGNPFAEPVSLLPNPPDEEIATIEFGPLRLRADTDTFTFLLETTALADQPSIFDVWLGVCDISQSCLADATLRLGQGQKAVKSLTFTPSTPAGVLIRIAVSFHEFTEGSIFDSVRLTYLLAHRRNALVELCNAARTDKGTEIAVANDAPHC